MSSRVRILFPAESNTYAVFTFHSDGTSQSKSSGDWKNYTKNEYWFEKSDWVHGGETDTPSLPEDTCQQLLVVRVAEEGREHTVFID